MKKRPKPAYKEYRDGRQVIDLSTRAGKDLYIKRLVEAWSRDGYRCGICRRPIDILEAVTDHIKPKGLGGATHDDRVENLQASHPTCNIKKGSKRNFHIEHEIIP